MGRLIETRPSFSAWLLIRSREAGSRPYLRSDLTAGTHRGLCARRITAELSWAEHGGDRTVIYLLQERRREELQSTAELWVFEGVWLQIWNVCCRQDFDVDGLRKGFWKQRKDTASFFLPFLLDFTLCRVNFLSCFWLKRVLRYFWRLDFNINQINRLKRDRKNEWSREWGVTCSRGSRLKGWTSDCSYKDFRGLSTCGACLNHKQATRGE